MIYGASTHAGKKILNHALTLNYKPVLAGSQGQELVEISFQTGLPCKVFTMKETKKIQLFLENISVLILCQTLSSREHKRLLKACLLSGVHYIDRSHDIVSYQHVMDYASRYYKAGLTSVPGLHPSVILSDFVASTLKSQLHDAQSLSLACSESFTSLHSMVNSLQRGGRVLVDSKLRKPDSSEETLLVPFNGTDTLTVTSAQADLLAAWQATRIPHVSFYRKADEKEVRLRKHFQKIRWLLHFPLFKKWVYSQENFLIRHFRIKAFYPKKYTVWGKATNPNGKSLSLRIEIVQDYDLALDVCFKVLEKLLNGELRAGLLTSSQILGSEYWQSSENLTMILPPN